jgi:hypothetical protein
MRIVRFGDAPASAFLIKSGAKNPIYWMIKISSGQFQWSPGFEWVVKEYMKVNPIYVRKKFSLVKIFSVIIL